MLFILISYDIDDDANQLPSGGASEEASFKLVNLEDVIPKHLLGELDPDWDPRARVASQ